MIQFMVEETLWFIEHLQRNLHSTLSKYTEKDQTLKLLNGIYIFTTRIIKKKV